MDAEADGSRAVLRFLVDYRLVLYVAALLAMSLPLGLAWLADVELSAAARSTIVTVSFAVIVATYIAERRVGLDHDAAEPGRASTTYPLRLRVGVVLGVGGIAAAVYLALEGRPLAGLLFGAGALFFLQMAFRAHDGAETG